MQFTSDSRSFYERINGEARLRLLVLRFYHHMHVLPETQHIRAMHQADLASAQDKLFMFLSGWMGGPSLYIEKFGHPRLRQRHLPFSIGESERDQWMLCMSHALDDTIEDKTLRDELYEALYGVADFMRNKAAPE